jgi:hypothetical protein
VTDGVTVELDDGGSLTKVVTWKNGLPTKTLELETEHLRGSFAFAGVAPIAFAPESVESELAGWARRQIEMCFGAYLRCSFCNNPQAEVKKLSPVRGRTSATSASSAATSRNRRRTTPNGDGGRRDGAGHPRHATPARAQARKSFSRPHVHRPSFRVRWHARIPMTDVDRGGILGS